MLVWSEILYLPVYNSWKQFLPYVTPGATSDSSDVGLTLGIKHT